MKTTRSMTVTVGSGTVNFAEGTDVSDQPAEVIQRLQRAGALPGGRVQNTDIVEGGTDTIATTHYAEGTDVTGTRSDGSGDAGEGNDGEGDDPVPDLGQMTKVQLAEYAEKEKIEFLTADDKATLLAKIMAAKGITA